MIFGDSNNQLHVCYTDSEQRYSLLWVICFVLSFISSFFLSGASAPIPDLDPSYQAVLEYARLQDDQFGRDIIFTYGPLGFLNSWVSQGLFPFQRTIFALVWSGFVAWSATGVARQIPGPMKFVFLVWFLVYSHVGLMEQHVFFVMLYGCTLLIHDEKRRNSAVIVLTLFAFLALIKFTFFVAAAISVTLCALVQIIKRNYLFSIAKVVFFGTVFLTLWLTAGQQLGNLLPWIRGSLEITSGYTEAMAIFPKVRVLVCCLIAVALYLISLWVIIRSGTLSINRVGILLITLIYVFLSWKHGFVRADIHVMGFILFLPMAFAMLLTETFRMGMNRSRQFFVCSLFLGAVVLCNWAGDFQDVGTMLSRLIGWPQHMAGKSRMMLNLVTGDWERCFQALRMDRNLKRDPDLPLARSIVGNAPVDVINYRQWAALANNLNYHPRPVIQGYSVYTPYLQDLNLAFYRSENRPQYLLFKMETIDSRFPTLDDATLLPFILKNYKPVAKDGEFLVLQAATKITGKADMTLIHEQKIVFGETMDLSAFTGGLTIMQVDVAATHFGRLVNLLFQSPVLELQTRLKGTTVNYRFIPAMADRGFVISPLLLTNNDVVQFYEKAAVNYPDSIMFSKPEYSWGQLEETITVRLYRSGLR